MRQVTVWELVENEEAIQLSEMDLACTTLDEVSLQLPMGVYTTFRTYRGSFALGLGDHFVRLTESARLSGFHINANWDAVRNLLRIAIKERENKEKRIRIHCGQKEGGSSVYIMMEMLHTPTMSDYENGVYVDLVNLRRNNPLAKRTQFIEQANNLRDKFPPNLNEMLMVDGGCILEGLSSNFFAVQDNKLYTAGNDVLPGLTQRAVLEVARLRGIFVEMQAINIGQLSLIQEAFITSASRGVLPVYKIGSMIVGAGVPGPVTLLLMRSYEEWIEQHIEPI